MPRRPIVANMIEHGRTPVLPRERLVELGFQLILYPLSGVFAAARALERIYQQLADSANHRRRRAGADGVQSFNDLIGVEEKYRLAERFGVRD